MNGKTEDKPSRSVNDWGWGCENPPKLDWFVGISDVSLKAAADVSPGFMADAITPLEHREYPYKGKTYSGHNFIRKLIVDDLKKRGIKRETIDNFSHLYDSENVAKMLTVMTTAGVEMFLLVDENGNGAVVDPIYLALARKGAIKGKTIDFKNSLMLRLNQYVEQAMDFIFPVRQAYSLCGAYAFAVTSSDALSDVSPAPLEAKDDKNLAENPTSRIPYPRGLFKDTKKPGENLIEVIRVLDEIEITDEALKVNAERVVDANGNTIYEY